MSVDLLQEEDNDFRVINFFPVESFRGTFFRWTSGNRALVKGKGTGIVKVHLLIPTEHTELKIRLGSLSHNITALQPWFRFQIDLTAETEDWELEFEVDRWNHHKAEIAEGDSRALSLLFEKLHFLRSLASKEIVRKRFSKPCLYPFYRMELESSDFSPCCRWWVEKLPPLKAGEDPWNSEAARELRKSILDGSFRYCKTDICTPQFSSGPTASRLGDFLENQDIPLSVESVPPLHFTFTADPRCNLSCPSCRSKPITTINDKETKNLSENDQYLDRHRRNLKVLTMATNGEVFYSPYLRKKLSEATRENYPSLEGIEIVSNGLLCNERSWQELRPGTDNIRWVRISVDAGDSTDYGKVRGGNWNQLQANLQWLKALRHQKRIERFSLNFVVQKDNLNSLKSFFQMASELEADEIFLSPLLDWPHMKTSQMEISEFDRSREILQELLQKNWPFQVAGNFSPWNIPNQWEQEELSANQIT